MKKLILISALLFSFNGWAEEDFEKLTNFSLYYKDLRDVSENLHRCSELFTALGGYLEENTESSLFSSFTSEQWTKQAIDITTYAVSLELFLGIPNKIDSFEDRFVRIAFYKDRLREAEIGNQSAKDFISSDMQVCKNAIENNMGVINSALNGERIN